MISHEVFISLLKSIAKASIGKKHLRINSFAVIDHISDIQAVNANQGVSGANKGYYWSRFGITPNNDKKLYPTLFLLKKNLRQKKDNYCYQYAMGVAVPPKCDQCGPEFTKMDAEFHAEKLMSRIWNVLCEVKLYDVIIDGERTKIFAHPSQLSCLDIEEMKGECGSVADYIQEDEASIATVQYGSDKVMLAQTIITLCGCKKVDTIEDFDFCIEDKESKGAIIKCDSCF